MTYHEASRTILGREFSRRKATNKRYSLRSFSRDIGLSHSFLSRYLRGQAQVSETKALEVSYRSSMTDKERALYVETVRLENAKSPSTTGQIVKSLDKVSSKYRHFAPMIDQQFYLVNRWYQVAVLDLLEMVKPPHTANRLARRMGISETEMALALDRLESAKAIRRRGTSFVRCDEWTEVVTAPPEVLRQFHRQMLTLAAQSLDRQDPAQREVAGITAAINSARIPEARRMIREFTNELSAFLSEGPRDAVYQFETAFFRLDVGTRAETVNEE